MKLNHATSCFNIKFSSIPVKDKQGVKRKPYAMFDFPEGGGGGGGGGRALLREWIKCTYH